MSNDPNSWPSAPEPHQRAPRLEHHDAQPYHAPHPSGQGPYDRPWPGDNRGQTPPQQPGGWSKKKIGLAAGGVLILGMLLGSCGGDDPAPPTEQTAPAPEAPQEEPEPEVPAQSPEEIQDEAFLALVRDLPSLATETDAELTQNARGMCLRLESGDLTPVEVADVVLETRTDQQSDLISTIQAGINTYCPEQMEKFAAAEDALSS